MMTQKGELSITVAYMQDGDIEVTLDDKDTVTGIRMTTGEWRNICSIVLEACSKVDACHYSSSIGHA